MSVRRHAHAAPRRRGIRLVGWQTHGVTRFSAAAVGLVRACHPEACVAVALTAVLLGIAIGLDTSTLLLVGGAVLAGQLSVGWTNDVVDAARDAEAGRVDKPVASGQVGLRTATAASVLAGIACVPLSLSVGALPGTLHIIAVALALGYDVGVKSTVFSVVPYVVSFGLLPLFVTLARPHTPVHWWLPAAGALLGGGAHFANVLPDLAADIAGGVRGLPHRIGATASRACAALLLLGASVLLAVGPDGHLVVRLVLVVVSALVLLGGFAIGRRPGSRAPFRSVLVVALLDVVLLVIAGVGLR
jgi:4-hydroxybenzoate polyprenyltransferase